MPTQLSFLTRIGIINPPGNLPDLSRQHSQIKPQILQFVEEQQAD